MGAAESMCMLARINDRIEEWANAASHGLAFCLALAAWPALAAAPEGGRPGPHPLGAQVFILTMLLMFVVSALYHAAPAGRLRLHMRRLDHAMIFLTIAGSCTAFGLGQMGGGMGGGMEAGIWAGTGGGMGGGAKASTFALPWWSIAAVWAVACVGMALKVAGRLRQTLPSTLLYLAFGWLAAAAALPALRQLNATAWALLLAGGLAYSVGSWFYLLGHRVRWCHLVWHLLVIAGAGCHLLALQQSGR